MVHIKIGKGCYPTYTNTSTFIRGIGIIFSYAAKFSRQSHNGCIHLSGF